jgi:hypothetical protein
MMNSEIMFDLQKVIEEVLDFIGEDYLLYQIDEPIRKAALEFNFDTITPIDPEFFKRMTGDFICHIYKRGLRVKKIMATEQAQSEALFILEHNYQSAYDRGYHAAYLDASNPYTGGPESVMAQMTEAIILIERSKHVQWVLASRISSKDWHTKCLIAEILLDRWKSYLPPNILACSPAQLADNLPALFKLFVTTNRVFNRMLTGDTPLNGLQPV